MKKITLLSILASALIFAGGDIDPIEPVIEAPMVEEPMSAGIPMGLALLGGVMKGEGDDAEWDPVYGAEYSFECLFSEDVRSQIQFTYYDQNDLKMYQLSANPHYIFNKGDAVEVAAGPHIGVAKAELGSEDDIVFTYGLGVSAKAAVTENVFVGAEARYEWTTDAEFNGIEDDLNNAKIFGKIGYSF